MEKWKGSCGHDDVPVRSQRGQSTAIKIVEPKIKTTNSQENKYILKETKDINPGQNREESTAIKLLKQAVIKIIIFLKTIKQWIMFKIKTKAQLLKNLNLKLIKKDSHKNNHISQNNKAMNPGRNRDKSTAIKKFKPKIVKTDSHENKEIDSGQNRDKSTAIQNFKPKIVTTKGHENIDISQKIKTMDPGQNIDKSTAIKKFKPKIVTTVSHENNHIPQKNKAMDPGQNRDESKAIKKFKPKIVTTVSHENNHISQKNKAMDPGQNRDGSILLSRSVNRFAYIDPNTVGDLRCLNPNFIRVSRTIILVDGNNIDVVRDLRRLEPRRFNRLHYLNADGSDRNQILEDLELGENLDRRI